jgi:broad specificity phosphatase PhoE
MLIVVRHAMPAADPESPPDQWVLSDDGIAAARALIRQLPPDAELVSSVEPKAWQTLGASDAVRRDARFNEVERVGEPWGGDFRRLRRAYVSGVEHRGWEPHESVAARFRTGLDAHLARAGEAPLVIASHGMAITVWLVDAGVIPREDAAKFWSDLRFPDRHLVDLANGSVQRLRP